MRPGLSCVRGFVNPVSDGQIRPVQPFPAPDINNIRIGRCHSHGSDRACGLLIEDGRPRAAVVVRLPHASIAHADVKHVRLAGNTCSRFGPAAAERSNAAPVHLREEFLVVLLCKGRCAGEQGKRQTHPDFQPDSQPSKSHRPSLPRSARAYICQYIASNSILSRVCHSEARLVRRRIHFAIEPLSNCSSSQGSAVAWILRADRAGPQNDSLRLKAHSLQSRRRTLRYLPSSWTGPNKYRAPRLRRAPEPQRWCFRSSLSRTRLSCPAPHTCRAEPRDKKSRPYR